MTGKQICERENKGRNKREIKSKIGRQNERQKNKTVAKDDKNIQKEEI